jgi:hypothetical protein
MCIDYRDLNKILAKNQYLLLRIDDLLDYLKDVNFFTNIDLKSGYHQISIESLDAWKNTFKTKEGLFKL